MSTLSIRNPALAFLHVGLQGNVTSSILQFMKVWNIHGRRGTMPLSFWSRVSTSDNHLTCSFSPVGLVASAAISYMLSIGRHMQPTAVAAGDKVPRIRLCWWSVAFGAAADFVWGFGQG